MSQNRSEPLIQKQAQPDSSRTNQSQLKLLMSLLFFSYELNYEGFLEQDRQILQENESIVHRIFGYKKYQLIFLHYFRQRGPLASFIICLLLPLPLSLLFYWLGNFVQGIQSLQQLQIIFIGLRCSVISYLLRYCLHFPSQNFNWVMYFGSIIISLIFRNNYVFIIIYLSGVFLSYYQREDGRDSKSILKQQQIDKQIRTQISINPNLQIANRRVYIFATFFLLASCLVVSKLNNSQSFSYHLVQFFIVSLLNTSQEISIFYPNLYASFTSSRCMLSADLYSLGYLFPGLHLKAIFLFFGNRDLTFFAVVYIIIHLPSLLMVCIYLGYKSFFHSLLWKGIMESVQFVSNGLILVAVITMISEQTCHSNIVLFTSIVIFTVTKLYKFNQIISAFLGIFLVSSRASVLHFGNKTTISQFLCHRQ